MKHEFLTTSLIPDSLLVLGLGADFVPRDADVVELLRLPAYAKAESGKRRLDFFRGRKLAREALERLSGKDPGWLGRDEAGLPIWPSRSRGSISHTDDGAVAWVGMGAQIPAMGVDLQSWLSDERAERVAERVLNAREREVVRGAGQITLAFSIKECIFKVLGNQGETRIDFAAFTVTELAPSRWTATQSQGDGSVRTFVGAWKKLDAHALAWGIERL